MENTSTNPEEKKGGFWTNIRERIKRFFRRLGGIKEEAAPSVDKRAGEVIPESMKQLYANLDKEEQFHRNNKMLLPGVEEEFFHSVRFMFAAGFRDGIAGIKKIRNTEMVLIAKNRASRLFKLAHAVLSGRASEAESNLKAKEELKNRKKSIDTEQHEQLNILEYYRSHHPKSYNKWWAIICIVCGLVLVAADIPLSIKLFEIGFDFTNTWESFLPAIGVSFCTVFIKIYYDYYIGEKYGSSLIIQAKYKSLHQKISIDEEHLKDKIKREQQSKRWWHNGILVLTVSGIVILGFFRVASAKLQGFDFSKDQQEGMPALLYALTFIFLTLIFPVISGVCFSIGLSGFQNISRYKHTKKCCDETEEMFIKSLEEFTAAQKDMTDIESLKKKWNEAEMGEGYQDIFLSYYDYAYKLGMVNPYIENNGDLYDIVQDWRNNALTRKTNNHLIKLAEYEN